MNLIARNYPITFGPPNRSGTRGAVRWLEQQDKFYLKDPTSPKPKIGSALTERQPVKPNDPAAKQRDAILQAVEEEQSAPLRGAAITVALLALLYCVSLVDRSMLALLAQPVAKALALDDRQLALLLGLGFALLYAAGGLFLGHLVDTRNRRIVVTAGVALWSLSTILSGFANGFWMLLILRSGIALGEAVLTPAAISLIADLYPRHLRGMPVAIFTSVSAIMTIGSYAVGAVAIDLATAASVHTGLEPWQLSFVFVGLPGLVLAALFALTATVPGRRTAQYESTKDTEMRVVLTYLRARAGFFGPLLALTGLSSLYSLAIIAWLPALLVRELGLSPSHVGYLLALVGMPAGLIGNFFWQWVATRKQMHGSPHDIVRTFWLPALLAAPAYAIGLMMDSLALQLAFIGIAIFMSSVFSVVSPMSIQLFGPPQMRARLSSINLMFVALLGYGLAPLAAVELGGLVAGEGRGLRQGLILLTLLVWPIITGLSILVIRKSKLAELQ